MPSSDQLNLFDFLPEPSPTPPEQATTHERAPVQAKKFGPAPHAYTSPPDSLPPGVRWRKVETPLQTIGYLLRRSRRRSIGLTINDDGLLVTAPSWVTLGQVDSVVLDKHEWILRKLAQRQQRQEQLATANTQWQHGGRVPYLGKRIVLHLDSRQIQTHFHGEAFSPCDDDLLTLPLPIDADRLRIQDGTHAWLQQQAKAWFTQRTHFFLEREGLQIKQLRLSAASTRWGSCSSDGKIMLNWRLIHFEPDVIDYVIVHEIAHLIQMNHSPAFWRELGRILPGFERARDALRHHHPGSLPLL